MLFGVIVLFVGMSSWTAVAEMSQECLRDREPASYIGTIQLMRGTLEWTGVGFICSGTGSLSTNRIPFGSIENCASADAQYGECGPYNASLVCNTGNENQMSVLLFVANYMLMNGGTILFQEYLASVPDDIFRNITVRVGVQPDSPEHVNLTFPLNGVCQYDWVPPNGNVTGGIRGYHLSYEGDCGTCSPIAGMVSSSTLVAECRGWIADGQTCHFEVRTVTEDCGFHSTPANVTSILDNTHPTDVTVVVNCSQNVDSPQIHVTWMYTPPEVENTTIIPGVLGFLVTIYDDVSNNNYSQYLNNSGVRAHSFNSKSPEFQNASLEGSIRLINVTVETDVGNFSNGSDPFSVEGTITDISSTLTTEQCIEVSINQHCNESADSFQARLRFADGACENNGTIRTTENYTLQNDYETCIRVETDPICFSAFVFRNGVEVARTVSQQLILLQCNTSTLSPNYDTGVQLTNSSSMDISLGVNVPHNTVVYLQCTPPCTLMGTNTTRCVNGTFELLVNQSTFCKCPMDSLSTEEIIGIAVGAVFAIIFIILIILIIIFVTKKMMTKDGGAAIKTPGQTDGGVVLQDQAL